MVSAAKNYENVFVDKDLILEGGYTGCSSGSALRSIIDGGGSGSVMVISSGLNVTIKNVNLTNGSTSGEGGGIQFAKGAGAGLLSFDNVKIYGNLASWGGGRWIGAGASLQANDVDIDNNSASGFGGGLAVEPGAYVTLNNTDITNNHASFGGGIHVGPDALVILDNDSDLDSNTAKSDGGGARVWGMLYGYESTSDISNNCAANGGGLSVSGGVVILNNSDVVANHAAGPAGKGGGIHVYNGGQVNLDDSVFIGETAPCCQQAYPMMAAAFTPKMQPLTCGAASHLSSTIRLPTTAAESTRAAGCCTSWATAAAFLDFPLSAIRRFPAPGFMRSIPPG